MCIYIYIYILCHFIVSEFRTFLIYSSSVSGLELVRLHRRPFRGLDLMQDAAPYLAKLVCNHADHIVCDMYTCI